MNNSDDSVIIWIGFYDYDFFVWMRDVSYSLLKDWWQRRSWLTTWDKH